MLARRIDLANYLVPYIATTFNIFKPYKETCAMSIKRNLDFILDIHTLLIRASNNQIHDELSRFKNDTNIVNKRDPDIYIGVGT